MIKATDRQTDGAMPRYEKPVLTEQRVDELVQLGSGPNADTCCCCLQS